jgi:hypothetical protein
MKEVFVYGSAFVVDRSVRMHGYTPSVVICQFVYSQSIVFRLPKYK